MPKAARADTAATLDTCIPEVLGSKFLLPTAVYPTDPKNVSRVAG
jgi:hypothetical protein